MQPARSCLEWLLPKPLPPPSSTHLRQLLTLLLLAVMWRAQPLLLPLLPLRQRPAAAAVAAMLVVALVVAGAGLEAQAAGAEAEGAAGASKPRQVQSRMHQLLGLSQRTQQQRAVV